MLKLTDFHSSLAQSSKYYEEDPDAPALETNIELVWIGSVQQVLTHADEDNLFGDCVLCRQPIAEDRLKKLPWAAYCDTCDPGDKK